MARVAAPAPEGGYAVTLGKGSGRKFLTVSTRYGATVAVAHGPVKVPHADYVKECAKAQEAETTNPERAWHRGLSDLVGLG